MARKKKEMDKLSQDAAAAKAANMSYGNWKAMQERHIPKKEPKIPEGWLVCQYCGKPFKPKTKRKQFYCEVGCQKAAQIERDKEKNKERCRDYRKRKMAEAAN